MSCPTRRLGGIMMGRRMGTYAAASVRRQGPRPSIACPPARRTCHLSHLWSGTARHSRSPAAPCTEPAHASADLCLGLARALQLETRCLASRRGRRRRRRRQQRDRPTGPATNKRLSFLWRLCSGEMDWAGCVRRKVVSNGGRPPLVEIDCFPSAMQQRLFVTASSSSLTLWT